MNSGKRPYRSRRLLTLGFTLLSELNLSPLDRNTGDKSQRRNTGVLFKYQSWEEALLLSHGQNELSGKKERGKSERFRITDWLPKSHAGLLSSPDVSEARAILTSAQARQRVSLLDSMKCDTEVTFNTSCHEMNTLTKQWSSSLSHEHAPLKSKKWNELKPLCQTGQRAAGRLQPKKELQLSAD